MPWNNVTFRDPMYLAGLVLVPVLVLWYIRRGRDVTSHYRYSTLLPFAKLKATLRERLRHLPFVFRMIVLSVLVVALARPQTTSQGENIYSEGIDIALLLDISGSMLAEDLQPNRVEAAKEVAQNFIDGRKNDRIGLVIFSGRKAYIQDVLKKAENAFELKDDIEVKPFNIRKNQNVIILKSCLAKQ